MGRPLGFGGEDPFFGTFLCEFGVLTCQAASSDSATFLNICHVIGKILRKTNITFKCFISPFTKVTQPL